MSLEGELQRLRQYISKKIFIYMKFSDSMKKAILKIPVKYEKKLIIMLQIWKKIIKSGHFKNIFFL